MSFASSFVQTLTPTLRDILGQAIQTQEAKKRYEEYFRMQGGQSATQHGYNMAEEQSKALNEIKAKEAEAQAAKIAHFSGPAVGWIHPVTGEFHLGFGGGAPAGAQTVYRDEIGQTGMNKILDTGLRQPGVTIPVQIGNDTFNVDPGNAASLGVRANGVPAPGTDGNERRFGSLNATLSEARLLAAAGNKEYQDLLGVGMKVEDPSASELNNRAELFMTRAKENGERITEEYNGKSYPVIFAEDLAEFSAAADSIGTEPALQRVLKRGLRSGRIVGPVGTDGALGDIKTSGGFLVRNRKGWKDSPVTPADAFKHLTDAGVPPLLAEARIAELGFSVPKDGTQGQSDTPANPNAVITPIAEGIRELGY